MPTPINDNELDTLFAQLEAWGATIYEATKLAQTPEAADDPEEDYLLIILPTHAL